MDKERNLTSSNNLCWKKKPRQELFTVGTAGRFGDFYCDSLVITVRCRISMKFVKESSTLMNRLLFSSLTQKDPHNLVIIITKRLEKGYSNITILFSLNPF